MKKKITETRHYYRVPFEITEDKSFKDLPASTQVFYHVLCRLANNYADTDGFFYRSLKTLSDDSGLNFKTLSRAKKQLLDMNLIEVNRRYFENNKKRASDYYKINGFTFRNF